MSPQVVTVRVQPEILTWARTGSGVDIDDAARSIHVEEGEMQRWEQVESDISVPRLRGLANLYKRPLAMFFLASPPEEPPLPNDFRPFLPQVGKKERIKN